MGSKASSRSHDTDEPPRTVRVGVLGLGTVGSGVVEILDRHRRMIAERSGAEIEIVRALVRSKRRRRPGLAARVQTTTDPADVIGAPDIDIVMELMGGEDPAYTYVLDALRAGQSVITANKAIIAAHGDTLLEAAAKYHADIFFEAAVAGGIPIVRTVRESLSSDRIVQIGGILNGTTNYILSQMHAGQSYEQALKHAQTLGYAEADPTLDVTGRDAADKLAILIGLAFGARVRPDAIETQGIVDLPVEVLQDAADMGCRVKLVAWASYSADSEKVVNAAVSPCLVPSDCELSAVPEAQNSIAITSESLGTTIYQGPGAGGLPTGSAVVADLIEAARNLRLGIRGAWSTGDNKGRPRVVRQSQAAHPYYLRLNVEERPGVLAAVAKVLASSDVSIATVVQREATDTTQPVSITMTTHETADHGMQKAIKRLTSLAVLRGAPVALRFFRA